jgi:hypothetical protein
MGARHVRRSPSLLDENELGEIKVQLIIEPELALLQEIGAALLYRVTSLFVSGHVGRGTDAAPIC